MNSFSPGKTYKNFRVERVVLIDEIQTTLIELKHLPSGAQILHLAADDDENLFSLSFQTRPEKSHGVAHVLEHTVLCGSEKFPVKDPFFSMNRRSLNTFMNAITGSDFTCYPASSCNPQDFYNLLDVYLDAVFHPQLRELSFLQEGHRLEFEESDNASTPLAYKGVVFSEMKGAMSSPDARLDEAMMASLFPDLIYRVNSGGSPKEIPSLTYKELKDFHKSFYHPSRCLFFFYGNLPLQKHLDFLEEHALKNVTPLAPLPPLGQQKRFTAKKKEILSYPIAADEDLSEKSIISMGWLTCSILDQVELLALATLDLVLMGTDAAPLKCALLKSGLCKQAELAIEDEMSEIPMILTMRGCKKESGDAIEKVVFDTLSTLAKEGLPSHLVEGALHQLEFSRSEISVPYGLTLFFRSALLKQHGGNPEDGLKIHSLFAMLREKLKDPSFFAHLMRKYFIDNPHMVRIDMNPDSTLEAKELAEEEAILSSLKKNMDQQEAASLIAQANALQSYQEEEGNLSLLPEITLKDVAKIGKEFILEKATAGPLTLLCHPTFTNEIVYADLFFPLPEIKEEDLFYLRLFTLFLAQVGAAGHSYKENLDLIFQYTGGIGADLELAPQLEGPSHLKPALILRGKALYRHVEKLFSLFSDFTLSPTFTEKDRIKELLIQHFDELEEHIQTSSLRYAVMLAASGLSTSGKINQNWYGLDYFRKLKELVKNFDKKASSLIEKMESLKSQVLGLKGAELVLSCDEKMWQKIQKSKGFGLDKLPSLPYQPWKDEQNLPKVFSQGRITSSPVAFTALLFKSVPYPHPYAAACSVAAKIMENRVLHRRIREQGGAYGSGAQNISTASHFYFYSYRDPHIGTTIDAFHEAVTLVQKGDFNLHDLEEAKLGIFQDLDSPIAPGAKAITAYMRLRMGRTPEVRAQHRKELLEVNIEKIQKATEEILLPGLKEGILVTFSGKELLEKETKELKEPLPLYPI